MRINSEQSWRSTSTCRSATTDNRASIETVHYIFSPHKHHIRHLSLLSSIPISRSMHMAPHATHSDHPPSSSTSPQIGSNKQGIHYPSSENRPAFSSEWTTESASGYRISEHLLGEPPQDAAPFRILCLGAGASGIDFLHHAITLDSFRGLNVEIQCYEKNSDVGGTWLENRYESVYGPI